MTDEELNNLIKLFNFILPFIIPILTGIGSFFGGMIFNKLRSKYHIDEIKLKHALEKEMLLYRATLIDRVRDIKRKSEKSMIPYDLEKFMGKKTISEIVDEEVQ